MCELTCAFVSVCVCVWVIASIFGLLLCLILCQSEEEALSLLWHTFIYRMLCVRVQWLSNCITDVISMFICSCQSFDSLCNASMFVNLSTGVLVCVYVYVGVSVYTQQKERTINILHKCRNKRLRQDDIHTQTHTEQTFTHTQTHSSDTPRELHL